MKEAGRVLSNRHPNPVNKIMRRNLTETSIGEPYVVNMGLVRQTLETSPRFLLLDFKRVPGMDATAAQHFVALGRQLTGMDVTLLITNVEE